MISLAVPAAGWVVLIHPEITPPSNFHQLRDTTVAGVVGYEGDIVFDRTKPDGTPRQLMDVSRLTSTGWQARIPLEEGVRGTYRWYLENRATARA